MALVLALLGTDTPSEILKQKNRQVIAKAAAYLATHGSFAFSALTRYEILRGLKDKKATVQLQRFDLFCQQSLIYEIADSILIRAADLWVTGRQLGSPRADADLIIAATAMEHGRVLVTGNGKHFNWIPGLSLDDWRVP